MVWGTRASVYNTEGIHIYSVDLVYFLMLISQNINAPRHLMGTIGLRIDLKPTAKPSQTWGLDVMDDLCVTVANGLYCIYFSTRICSLLDALKIFLDIHRVIAIGWEP